MKVLFPGNCILDKRTMERNNIQLQSPRSSSTSTYSSGDYIDFECKWWHQKVSRAESFRAECLDGVIQYPTCERECSVPRTQGAVGGSFAETASALRHHCGVPRLVFTPFPLFSLYAAAVIR